MTKKATAVAIISLMAAVITVTGFAWGPQATASDVCGYPANIAHISGATAVVNDKTVTVSWPYMAGETVTVQVLGQSYSVVLDSDGQGSITLPRPLNDDEQRIVTLSGNDPCEEGVTATETAAIRGPNSTTTVSTTIKTSSITYDPIDPFYTRQAQRARAEWEAIQTQGRQPAAASPPLAYTGGEVSIPIALGAGLIGSGGLVLLARNKRRRSEQGFGGDDH